MSEFNEYNFLCHYGIIGMKWGIRRYQNPDGSLTPEGLKRYGNLKTLKNKVNNDIAKQQSNQEKAIYTQKAMDLANRRFETYKRKYSNSIKQKDQQMLRASKEAARILNEMHEDNKKDLKKHYEELVKEYGKENVKDLNIKDGRFYEDSGDAATTIGNFASLAVGIAAASLTGFGVSYHSATTDEKARALESMAYESAYKKIKDDDWQKFLKEKYG